ncbi:hypothetical protein LSH36_334g04050 [Paralvinella palmiformis]|uniref:Cyclin-like domain-containing protein n=1 Tax=Paralvinella palmiformis TaxID=53620 RepID=A0AAD9JFK1_9ANNE|nr:hypothetical protein LSH36_334g04050 [Paralvinella palmiformis]
MLDCKVGRRKGTCTDVDPCLYIQRFAHKLEFGEKTHEVAMTALRLVQRMKRDWMAQGRRPSGLCGAALLVAGRIHDFNRKIKDIMRVVKIGEGTIRKRLAEFEATPSGQLTVDEFQNIDLEEEMDPPCFTEGKRKAKLQQLEEQGQLGKITAEIALLQKEIEKQLAKENEKRFRSHKNKNYTDLGTTDSDGQSSGRVSGDVTPCGSPSRDIDSFLLEETLKDVVSHTELGSIATKVKSFDVVSGPRVPDGGLNEVYRGSGDAERLKSGMRPRPSVTSLGITSSIEDYMTLTEEKTNEVEEEAPPETCELDLSGIDDEELESFILSEKEVRIKTKIWMEANADYLREQKEKLEREAKEREEEANKPEHKKRKRAQRKHTSKHVEHSTAADAIKNMLQEKKISSKINYDVLKDLNRTEEPGINSGKNQPNAVESTQLLSPHTGLTSIGITLNNSQIKRPLDVLKTEPLIKRIKAEDVIKKETKELNVKTESEPVIVESGPVQYHHTDTADLDEEDIYNEEDEEEDEEDQISAAQLLGHSQDDEDDDYYDDDLDE